MLTTNQRDILAAAVILAEKDNWNTLQEAMDLYRDYRKLIEEADINALDESQ